MIIKGVSLLVLHVMILNLIISDVIGQNTLSQTEIDFIKQEDQILWQKIESISLYNEIIRSENIKEEIEIRKIAGRVVFMYKGEEIKSINTSTNSPVQIIDQRGHFECFYARIQKSKTETMEVMITKDDFCEKRVEIKNYKNAVLIGFYVNKCNTGEVYEKGNYQQIDSLYNDTIITFCPETYKEKYRIEKRTKYPVKRRGKNK